MLSKYLLDEYEKTLKDIKCRYCIGAKNKNHFTLFVIFLILILNILKTATLKRVETRPTNEIYRSIIVADFKLGSKFFNTPPTER